MNDGGIVPLSPMAKAAVQVVADQMVIVRIEFLVQAADGESRTQSSHQFVLTAPQAFVLGGDLLEATGRIVKEPSEVPS